MGERQDPWADKETSAVSEKASLRASLRMAGNDSRPWGVLSGFNPNQQLSTTQPRAQFLHPGRWGGGRNGTGKKKVKHFVERKTV